MRAPEISVIIPCYNAAATIAETLASVTAQTCGDFEIIAIDDGSTDATAEVLAQLKRSEPRLRVISQANKGLSGARNTGIRDARGSLIALLDADDLWDADYLDRHRANLADPTVGVSYARLRYIDGASRPTGDETRPKLDGLGPADLLRANPCTSLVVVRRSVIDAAGPFDETMRRVEDQEWLFRIAVKGIRMRGIGRVLASYRITPGSLSSNTEAMLASFEAFLAQAGKIAPEVAAVHGRLALAGMQRYLARRALAHDQGTAIARRYLWRALRLAPDLLVREPLPTLATLVAVLGPRAESFIRARLAGLRARATAGAA